MKKRMVIRIISYVSALAVVFAASGILLNRAKAAYEDVLGRVRLAGLTSLCEYVHDISMSLRLLAVSSDENVSDAASVVSSRTMGALGSISCFENAENINTFLNGVADFADGFSSDKIDEEQRKNALLFSDYSQELYYHLSDVANAVVSGEYSLTEEKGIYSSNKKVYFENKLDYSNGKESEIFSRFATASAETRYASQSNVVSEDDAKENVAKFSGLQVQILRSGGKETVSGVQTFKFYHGETIFNACCFGGEVCRMESSHICSDTRLTFSQAEKTVEGLMKTLGCNDYEVLHYEIEDFSVRFIIAPVINGILFLPATISAEICLGEGAIMSFDACEYILRSGAELTSHDKTADISGLIPKILTLQKTELCYISVNGAGKYCYLAVCTLNNEKVLIFIDYYTHKALKTVLV